MVGCKTSLAAPLLPEQRALVFTPPISALELAPWDSRCNAAGRGETNSQEVAADGRRCRDEVSLGLTEGNLQT